MSCGGLSTKDHPPLVYAINLSSEVATLTLQRGDEALITFENVQPNETRVLTRVAEGDAVLRSVSGSAPREWTDPSGTPYVLRLERGHLYGIVVDPLGQAALYSLPEVYSNDPKLTVVNVTQTTLSQIQVAPDWAKNVKVYAQDIVPMVPSEFYSIPPKTLELFWQTLEQIPDDTHTFAKAPDGEPLRVTFEPGRYYLFLAGEGSVRELTPSLD